MNSKWQFLLSRFNRQLWVRAALYGVVGISTALIAALMGPLLPPSAAKWLGANAVKDLLTIMASSMLAVATFSLSIMVSAFTAASTSTTPRASTLLIEDKSAQRALSTFIGAFLFSIVGLIALATDIYGPTGRVVMFGMTVIVIGLVVVTLLNWIDQLARFGRVGETINRVEAAARTALLHCARAPTMDAMPATRVPAGVTPVMSARIGYIRHIDTAKLQRLADENGLRVHVALLPGAFTHPGRALAQIEGDCDDEVRVALAEAFMVGGSRTFDQDPRFGLIVLAEIAVRALSPAVNDPGTAIDVIGTTTRLLHQYREARRDAEVSSRYERVLVPELLADDLFDDVFRPIARDGAGMLEVGLSLQRALLALRNGDDQRFTAAAIRHARDALQRAEAALSFEADREVLRAACAQRRAS